MCVSFCLSVSQRCERLATLNEIRIDGWIKQKKSKRSKSTDSAKTFIYNQAFHLKCKHFVDRTQNKK